MGGDGRVLKLRQSERIRVQTRQTMRPNQDYLFRPYSFLPFPFPSL